MYPKAFCPSCKYTIYTRSKLIDGKYKFQCTCGCKFSLKKEFVVTDKKKKVSI